MSSETKSRFAGKTLYIIILLLFSTVLNYSQTEWFKYPGNPVLLPGPESWDIGSVGFGKVLFDGSEYKMWYTGGTSTSQNLQIGYATSVDGMNWSKDSSNPILTPGNTGTWEAGAVGTPTVILDGSEYKMWYAASMTNPPTQIRIGYATSTDGISWQKDILNNPVLDLGSSGEWDDYWVTQPTVVKDGSTYKMWYTGSRLPIGTERIGYAISPDGINWTKYDDPSTPNAPFAESDPVLEVTAGAWDQFYVFQPCVIINSSNFEMWYAGNNGSIQSIGHATSLDGIIWDKDTLNPVMTKSTSGQFDDVFLLAPSVILGSDQIYRMWYTGYGGSPQRWRIGFAATDPSVFPTSVELESFYADAFSLEQNYPNPFNPSTTISWQSPLSSHHTLKVYDLLGREIATLVDEYKPAGSYEVEFDASQISSGIYFYTLQAGEFTSTKKLILMK